ncbi:MAG: hypothetical protein Q7T51_04285 [Candidatus Moranbacteria bacterium]|nr:hypothetical protein [Candidatus Moranbacteria bacterium]
MSDIGPDQFTVNIMILALVLFAISNALLFVFMRKLALIMWGSIAFNILVASVLLTSTTNFSRNSIVRFIILIVWPVIDTIFIAGGLWKGFKNYKPKFLKEHIWLNRTAFLFLIIWLVGLLVLTLLFAWLVFIIFTSF